MRHSFVKIAAATPEIRVTDCAFNAAQICARIDYAASMGVKVLALPELCLTGSTCGDLFLQDALLHAAEQALETVRAHSKGMDMLLAVGMPLRQNGRLYNVAAVLQDGRILGFIPKINLAEYGEYSGQRYFSPVPNAEIAMAPIGGIDVPFGIRQLFQCESMQGLIIGVELGEDACVPSPPSTALCAAGATLVLNLSANAEAVGKMEYRRLLARSHSARLCCAYAVAAAGAGESTTDLVFSGHNLTAENGTILSESIPFERNAIAVTEIDLQRIAYERRRRNMFPASKEDRYERQMFTLTVEDTMLTRPISPTPFIPKADDNERCESILQIQVHGLMKRIEHTKSKAAVIGVSGGLDSTLTLFVAARAMRALNRPASDVYAVTMPCFGTTNRTRDNAKRLCDCLGIPCNTVDITAAVRQHFADIGQKENVLDAAFENAQARERTQVLMDIANQTGGFVVGTGNLSELALGWATYNGDHMSMYAVNSGVPKTLVRHMVRYIADTSGQGALREVLLAILDTPVSPELLPAQNGEISQITESVVGPYVLHDFFIYHMLRWGCTPEKLLHLAKIAFNGTYEEDTIKGWLRVFLRRFFSQQFKRSCMPDGPKIGTVSLSPRGAWRMPSDASDAVWQIFE